MSDRVLLLKVAGKPLDLNIIQVYAPTSASSEEDAENFYEEIEKAKNQCKNQDPLIIMGDFNAKVGQRGDEHSVGMHGTGNRNERGERLVEWCEMNNFTIGNTCFQQPQRRKWTWKSPGDSTRNQIDYILISGRFKNALLSAKSYPGADCYSDHALVLAKFRLKLKKNKKKPMNTKLNLAILRSDQDIRQKYALSVKNKFQSLNELEEVEHQWENFKQAINEAAAEVIPPLKRRAKQKWMTEDILNLMDKRRQAKCNYENYEAIHKEIRNKCDEAKENWIKEKCKEIELLQRSTPKVMYRNIEEIIGKRTCSSTGCLKTKEGSIIMDKEKILERWAEYIGELFEDNRKEHDVMKKNFAGPPIMKDELREAMRKMKTGKATGPDGLSIELIEALEEDGIEKVTTLLNEIYDTGQIPVDMSRSIFIALPKKPGATDCELHRTISLMSHVTKLLLRIIMMRVRNKINPEIAEEQCGFVEGKGTTNAIFILRTLIERALEIQKDVYLCFIDYTKAFDRVRHDEIIKELTKLKIDGKDLRIIKNMYWEQTAAMRVEGEISAFQKIKRGVRQGCVLSPDLFSLYSEIIMRNIEGQPGIRVGGHNINNLRYADDTVLISENEKDLQQLLNIVESKSKEKGLELNSKKTEVMVISRKEEPPLINITINGIKLKQRDHFKYLGALISSDGRNNAEISARIAQAKMTFQKMKTVLTNPHISIHTRKRTLECYIEPILMYGCEAWTISKQAQKKLEAVEMWFLRRMMKISWKAKKSNDTVLKEAHTSRALVNKIRTRQTTFFGHVMRREKLEHLITTGMMEGKRSRGKQREKMTDGLIKWLGAGKVVEILKATRDRGIWKDMITNAIKHGTG